MKYMLDTNICSYIFSQRPEIVFKTFQNIDAQDTCISTITYGELLFGAEKSQKKEFNLDKIYRFTDIVQVLSLDDFVAEHYGQIRCNLSNKGTPIGNNDLWIAAHALSQDLILVTNNEKEFCRVENLKVENWVA